MVLETQSLKLRQSKKSFNLSEDPEFRTQGGRLIIEQALQWCALQFGQQNIVTHFDLFSKDFGKTFHDDLFYDSRLAYFHDFYLSGSISDNDEKTRLQRYIISHIEVPEMSLNHSIFEIIRHFPTTLQCRNLFTKERLTIDARNGETFIGLSQKDIVQGHVYKDREGYFLSFGLIVHPVQVRAMTKKAVATAVKENLNKAELLSAFARKNLKHLRHKNVEPQKIYSLEL